MIDYGADMKKTACHYKCRAELKREGEVICTLMLKKIS